GNGEVRQSSNTSDMVHNCATIITYASTLMKLLPGDVIYTGTPAGVIAGYPKQKQLWLKPGDRLTTTIEKLGTLPFALARVCVDDRQTDETSMKTLTVA